jgi:hypothetical protein
MKINHPVNIDLLTFFKTGAFDYLKLGQTKKQIINNFPDPDDMFPDSYNTPVWFYGNIELHFHDDDETLYLIYSDYIDDLDGGESLQLEKWILNEPEKLTLEYVIHQLNKERIEFSLKHGMLSDGFCSAAIVLSESKVSLSFVPVEQDDEEYDQYLVRCRTADSNHFKLVSFGLG